jgi:uncharacterized protein YcbK (DUF882 family)
VKVTEHFSVEEFACHNGDEYPPEWVESRLRPLCETLEVLREALGGHPLQINSGYRSLAYNQKLGSHDTSQHPQGRAADVASEFASANMVRSTALTLYKAGKLPHLGGLGEYPAFVHLDVRPRPEDNHLAQWRGGRLTNTA